MEDIRARLHRGMEYDRKLVERKMRTIEVLPIELIAQSFPEGNWYMHYDGAEFELPYNFEYIPMVKEFMSIQFPEVEFDKEYPIIWEEHNSAAYFLSFIWDEHTKLQFRLVTEKEGTTCVLHKIGEKTKTIPIYEVTCGEAEEW